MPLEATLSLYFRGKNAFKNGCELYIKLSLHNFLCNIGQTTHETHKSVSSITILHIEKELHRRFDFQILQFLQIMSEI